MLEERAKVLSVGINSVWVEADRSQGCAKCEAGEGCGGGMLARLVKRSSSRIEVFNDVADIRPGDEVVIGINEKMLLRSSVMAYLLPIVGLFTGAFVAEIFLQANDLVVAGMASVGLVAGFMFFRQFSTATASDHRYRPIVLCKSAQGNDGCQVYLIGQKD